MAFPVPLAFLDKWVVIVDPPPASVSHIGLIIRHGAGAGVARFREYCEKTRAVLVDPLGAAVADVVYTPAMVARTYLTYPSLNDLVATLQAHSDSVVAVRFYSTQGQARVTLDGGSTSYRLLRTEPATGDALVIPWADAGQEPFRAPEEVRLPFARLGALTIWVAVAAAPLTQPAPTPVALTVISQADTARNPDGSFSYKASYAQGTEVRKSLPWMVQGAEWAGTSNAPGLLAWSNPQVFLDPNWYPLMFTLPPTHAMGTWETGCQGMLGTNLALERVATVGAKATTPDGRGGFFAARTEALRNLVTTMQLLVASSAPPEHVRPVVLAMITLWGCIVRRLNWVVSRPGAHLSLTPPWYYRELHPAGEKQPRDDGGS